MTPYQRAARTALAAEFGPAIVWSGWGADGDLQLQTDTTPCLRLQVDPGGAVTTPLDARAEALACDEFDRRRVDRVVWLMAEAARRADAPGPYVVLVEADLPVAA